MALLFLDSFDHYATADMPLKYPYVAGGTVGAVGRNSTSGGQCSTGNFGGAAFGKTFSANTNACIAGVAVTFVNTPFTGSNTEFLSVLNATDTHVNVTFSSDGVLKVYRNGSGGTLLGTSATLLSQGVFYYIELKTVIHASAGTLEVRVNGVPVIGPLTSQVTQTGSTANWTRVILGNYSSVFGNKTFNFDDLYVADSSGSFNTDFLGDLRIEALLPQTDAVATGSNAGLTPSTGTDHGALVDESTPNTTDYNTGTAAGVKDTYNFPTMATTSGTIKGVQTSLYVLKTTSGVRTVCPVLRHSGTDYDGTAVAPSTSYTYLSQIYETNPGTGTGTDTPFTIADITALQAGMKVVT